MIPKDPNDEKNIYLELRAGTGGDEAAIFVGDLFRGYLRYAENNDWKVEIMSSSESESGGYKEIVILVKVTTFIQNLKFEGGTHRFKGFLQQNLKVEFIHLLLQLLLCLKLMMLKLKLIQMI